ncbi:hypothetical protein HOLleu_34111 [Holothuria leucospilota]|uniref:Uncharacterized protein n=1 Tax=Holothuria leucospilota TaxID=206669 RepID=A0A9Q0YPU9_HOLLE|nr:hypothetical protein HOLleu_34111 [Holothuria leucospilota]
MADSKLITCVFVFLATLVMFIESLPIENERNRRDAYTLYSELVDKTERLRTMETTLLNNFKTNRLRNLAELTGVTVPNLSDLMTFAFRSTASPSQLLSEYRDHFMRYQIIMDFVLEDERNTTATPNFISDITNVSLLLSFTITRLENVMRHLNVTVTPEKIPEEESPYFTPRWERNIYQRRLRDCFVLEQLNQHLINAQNDFTKLRNDEN